MQRCVESRSIPLPAPPHYEGPQQVIPTMTQMFTETPAILGFNIEVKYPMPVSVEGKGDGQSELDMAKINVAKNDYMNRIIQCVEAVPSVRSIYYSSFDVDCCLMLLHKQAHYPVFLLIGDGCVWW